MDVICEYGRLKGRNITGIYEKKSDSNDNRVLGGEEKSGHKNK